MIPSQGLAGPVIRLWRQANPNGAPRALSGGAVEERDQLECGRRDTSGCAIASRGSGGRVISPGQHAHSAQPWLAFPKDAPSCAPAAVSRYCTGTAVSMGLASPTDLILAHIAAMNSIRPGWS